MKAPGQKLLGVVLCGALLAVAGCGTSTTTSTETEGSTSESASEIEIFSWWTGAGEAAGLDALIELFEQEHPEIKVNNAAVAGGAGTNAKAVLASRMQAGDPPDTFQVHASHELLDTWVAADKMEPLNDLYESEGWMDKFPKDLIDMLSKDGNIYAVPVDIHRGNVLFYNYKIFEENGLTPPTTFDQFFEVCEALKAKGITPLALGDKEPWTATQLFEDILLGVAGADGYNALFNGTKQWDDPVVREALEIFGQMLDYVNEDHAARNWQDAAQLVATGKAAMNVMGDWAKGYFTTDLGLKLNEDWGWVPTPETDDYFMIISDTFGLPKNIKHRDATIEWLKLLGSTEGQDAFNPKKGSIPARIDADMSKYDDYSKAVMEDFKTKTLTPSLAHGSAASPGFADKVNQVINVFVTSRDIDQAIQGLVDASSELM